MPDTQKLSKVEAIKEGSRYLRGTIVADMANESTPFPEADYQVLKFHGTYQQYDRDTATERKQRGLQKEYQCMVRVKIPGGRLTADQYLAMDALAGRYANGSLRITTRQGFQLYGVIKADLKATIADINATLLTTLGACGDVVRNLTTNPAPIRDAVHTRLEEDARMLARELAPRTRAYHEIWIDGECNRDRGVIQGFNVPQRVLITDNAAPGERHTIALLAANGPLAAPGGTVFCRYANLACEWTGA